MRATPTRIIRRRKSTARDGSFFKKENNAEQTFFGDHAQNASFFQPAATISRKCDTCEEESKEVHRAADKKQEEKKIHKAADKKEEDKKIHKAADKKDDEKKIHKQGDKKEDEKKVHRSTAKEDKNKYMHTQAERIADEKKRHEHAEKKKKHQLEKKKEEEKKLHRATDKKEDDKKIKRAIEIEENEEEHNRNLPVKHGEEDNELRLSEAGGAATGTSTTSAYIGTLNSGGSKLPAETTQFFYTRMGYNFDSVNIHTGVDAADSTKEVNAKAYAIDNHIVFNEGQYNPDSVEGKKLLAHELTHVVQNSDSAELQKSPDNENKK